MVKRQEIYDYLDKMQNDIDRGENPVVLPDTVRLFNNIRKLAIAKGIHASDGDIVKGSLPVLLQNHEARVIVSDIRRMFSDICDKGWWTE